MSKIRFLVDYRGVLTDEAYFTAGTVIDTNQATALVNEGRAEYIPTISQDISQVEPVLAVDIEDLPVGELKKMARLAGVRGYRKMKKAQLVDELRTD